MFSSFGWFVIDFSSKFKAKIVAEDANKIVRMVSATILLSIPLATTFFRLVFILWRAGLNHANCANCCGSNSDDRNGFRP